MGDVIHALPALTDAVNAIAGIRFDWVVEEGFKEIPQWHSAVDKVIPVAIRRWRKSPLDTWRSGEWQAFKQQLQMREYDAVIDAQGLLKSACLIVRYARGPSFGLDKNSAKEPWASKCYTQSIAVAKEQHAVERIRQLFAAALNYPMPEQLGDFAISEHFESCENKNYLVFNHSTTRVDKHYPEAYWQQLIQLAGEDGWKIKLPWGNALEKKRAQRLALGNANVEVLTKLSLCQVAQVLANAAGCISVDTGLSHLTAALNRPNITLFGPTDPGLVGGYGKYQRSLLASNFETNHSAVEPAIFRPLLPQAVWKEFTQLIIK
ncbi:MAG: heptosyl transferase I [Osedax symbiont Rs2]|nr:MAG: heptosyl transferase I [Osedax symbiont Rs2]